MGSTSLVLRYERQRAVNILGQPTSLFAGTPHGYRACTCCPGVSRCMFLTVWAFGAVGCPPDLERKDAEDLVDLCDFRVFKPRENICVEVGA